MRHAEPSPRTAGHHMGWEILEDGGIFWVPSRGWVEAGEVRHTFPDNFANFAAAVAAIDAHGKTIAQTQGDAHGRPVP